MVLIKSISGVRGTINDASAPYLCDDEVIKCVRQFACWLLQSSKAQDVTIAIGRDGRKSGEHLISLVCDTLMNMGVNVLNLDLTTTPSVQVAIIHEHCSAGIMISASHNPGNWNGLKLLNSKGEFLSKNEGNSVFEFSLKSQQKPDFLGLVHHMSYLDKHIALILKLDDVNVKSIKQRKFKIVVDGINSSGGIYVPYLLQKLGVETIDLNCVPDGNFQHDPEPIPENLCALCEKVKLYQADLGIAVDPDVDRLVLVCEDGSFFGEEYTLVAIAKYILSNYSQSSVVSNLSTTKAVKDVAVEYGAKHFESPVGEINVVELMKAKKSIVGGEGSGGVIFAKSHYGRDALVGIALLLSYLSISKLSIKGLRSLLPSYYMLKEKILLKSISFFDFKHFISYQVEICTNNHQKYILIDGIKMYYHCGSWAHIRVSNTEPVIRLIIESKNQEIAMGIKSTLINDINKFLK